MAQLDETLGNILGERQRSDRLRRLTVVPTGAIDFSSNDYLSLASNIDLQREIISRLEARIDAAERVETARGILGSGGSRLLDGNSAFAEKVEGKIAAFHRACSGLIFNSAYDANVGLLSCVPQPGDIILYDEAIHASVHEGMRLSRVSRKERFAHNSVTDGDSETHRKDLMPGIEEVLQQVTAGDQGKSVRNGTKNVFVCVEGIYSMDGTVAHLKKVVEMTKKYLPFHNGHIIVDEAHSVGVLGKQGRGLVCELGLEDQIWARVHGFGKAIGASGGIVLCSETVREYLINYARTLIYTTSMTYSSLVSLDTIYDYLSEGRAQDQHRKLYHLTSCAWALLKAMCLRLEGQAHVVRVGKVQPNSPVIPLYTAAPRGLAAFCQQRGFMVRAIVAPTVPSGAERVRICLHSRNSLGQIQALVRLVEDWAVGLFDAIEQPSGLVSQGSQDTMNQAVLRAKL